MAGKRLKAYQLDVLDEVAADGTHELEKVVLVDALRRVPEGNVLVAGGEARVRGKLDDLSLLKLADEARVLLTK